MYEYDTQDASDAQEQAYVEPARARRIRERNRAKARRANKHTRIVTAYHPPVRKAPVRWWEHEEVL